MSQIFAERFKSARVLNGMSLQDLADRLDNKITRQALHKYEKGEVIPDSKMVSLLSKALHVRPDFFFRDTVVELGEIEFRKLKKLPAKEEYRIIEGVKDILSRYLELEEILSIKNAFTNPVKHTATINSVEDIEQAAAEVRKAWKLGAAPIANCIELLEDNHIKVVEIAAGDSYDGMQTWVNKTIPVIAINKGKIKSPDRKRFTVLHELAHLVLPLANLADSVKEKYCHQFAAAMLLPKEVLIEELGKSRTKVMIPELGALKKQYGISMQAVVMRAKDLNILSDLYCKQFFFMVKQMGWKVNEPIEYIGEEQSGRFEQLLFRALAEELISMSKAAALSNQSLAEFRTKSLLIS